MPDKEPTQGALESGARRGSPDGGGKVEGLIPQDERGAGGGGPFAPKDAKGDFHGGQSGAAYHGHGQLGDKNVEPEDNPNSASKDA